MKNNSFSIISLAISVISLLVSVYIVCSENRFDADWYAIVIGVLSLLVTMLIGWNIYQAIDFERRIDQKTKSALLDVGADVEKLNDRTMYTLLASIADIMKEQANTLLAFDMYIKAAMFASKAKEKELTKGYMTIAIDIFDVMMKDARMERDRLIFKSRFRELDDYIDILKLIDCDTSNILLKKLILAREV